MEKPPSVRGYRLADRYTEVRIVETAARWQSGALAAPTLMAQGIHSLGEGRQTLGIGLEGAG